MGIQLSPETCNKLQRAVKYHLVFIFKCTCEKFKIEEVLYIMGNEFRVCDDCQATNVKTLIPKLKKVDSCATIEVACQSYCGPGRKKSFAFVNNSPVAAPTEDELIVKIEAKLNK